LQHYSGTTFGAKHRTPKPSVIGWYQAVLSCFTYHQARTQRGMQGMHSPPDLKRCWHDTWFHWKSSL